VGDVVCGADVFGSERRAQMADPTSVPTMTFLRSPQWSETTVVMKIGDNIKSRDINYVLTPSKLTLGIKNEVPIVDG
jgi:hypothetical protein